MRERRRHCFDRLCDSSGLACQEDIVRTFAEGNVT